MKEEQQPNSSVTAALRPRRHNCKTRRRHLRPKPDKIQDTTANLQVLEESEPRHWQTGVPLQPSAACAVRNQMRTTFCTTFIPLSEQYAYMHSLFDIGDTVRRNHDSACVVAGDALCVLQLGTISRSKRLILGYYDLYGKAIQRLRVDISRLEDGREVDVGAVVAAIYFLGLCESYASTRYDSRGFVEHIKGLTMMLEGEATLLSSRLSEEAAACFEHWRYVQAFGYGLVARKAARARPPAWDVTTAGGRSSVTALALKVPSCLEELESACWRLQRHPASTSVAEKITIALDDALRLRDAMNESIDDWMECAGAPPYLQVHIQEYPDLSASLGDLANAFALVLRFLNLPTAKTYRTYWVSLLTLDQAILDTCGTLLDLSGDVLGLDAMDDRTLAGLKVEAELTATLLAQSLPYLCSSCWNLSGSYGVLLPLHFLERYFEWLGYRADKQLAWCRRLKESVVLGYKIKSIMNTGG